VLVVALGTNCVGSSLAVGIFLYVAQTVERVLVVALGTNCVGSSLAVGIFLYVAQTVARVLVVALGTYCWFEFRCRHISLCSPGS